MRGASGQGLGRKLSEQRLPSAVHLVRGCGARNAENREVVPLVDQRTPRGDSEREGIVVDLGRTSEHFLGVFARSRGCATRGNDPQLAQAEQNRQERWISLAYRSQVRVGCSEHLLLERRAQAALGQEPLIAAEAELQTPASERAECRSRRNDALEHFEEHLGTRRTPEDGRLVPRAHRNFWLDDDECRGT